MLRRMSAREFAEWMEYYKLEPFGQESEYLGHAITASTIANVNRGKNKKAYKPSDFMPQFRAQSGQTEGEQMMIAEMFTAAMGGQDLRE